MPEEQGNAGNSPEPTFEEILQFDPFDGGAAQQEPQQQKEPPEGQQAPEQPPPAEQEPTQEEPPLAAQPQPAPRPITQSDLEATLMRQAAHIAQAVQPQAQQPQQQLKFNLGVPDQLLSALRSEDPAEFKAGIGAMINSVANHVWNSFVQAVQNELLPAIPRMIDQQLSSSREQENVGRDFYGKYPQLNNPMFAPMIQSVGAALAQEYAAAGRSLAWSPELRDHIAERIFGVLPQLRQGPQQAAPTTRRSSFSTGSGARPAPAAAGPENDMMEMIFGPARH